MSSIRLGLPCNQALWVYSLWVCKIHTTVFRVRTPLTRASWQPRLGRYLSGL